MSLKEMSADDLSLIHELSKRLLDLHDLYQRVHGVECMIPKDMENDFKRFNALKHRCYVLNDCRISESETKAVRTIAQWSLDVKKSICGQPRQVLQWRD